VPFKLRFRAKAGTVASVVQLLLSLGTAALVRDVTECYVSSGRKNSGEVYLYVNAAIHTNHALN